MKLFDWLFRRKKKVVAAPTEHYHGIDPRVSRRQPTYINTPSPRTEQDSVTPFVAGYVLASLSNDDGGSRNSAPPSDFSGGGGEYGGGGASSSWDSGSSSSSSDSGSSSGCSSSD